MYVVTTNIDDCEMVLYSVPLKINLIRFISTYSLSNSMTAFAVLASRPVVGSSRNKTD